MSGNRGRFDVFKNLLVRGAIVRGAKETIETIETIGAMRMNGKSRKLAVLFGIIHTAASLTGQDEIRFDASNTFKGNSFDTAG